MNPKILIVGAGAIGAFYGALLARQGAQVSVVCRSDYDTVKQHGFIIDSTELGQWRFMPEQVLKTAAEYKQHADYVLLCSKGLPTIKPASLIGPAIHSDTAVVFIQNGVEIEQAFANAFPEHDIISALAFICCNRLQPGQISHTAYGRLALGNYPAGCTGKTRQLAELFQGSGIKCDAVDDIVKARWQKNVWNAAFNPLSVLSGGLLTLDILTHQEELVRSIMQEICCIAAALGHPLGADIIDRNIRSTQTMPPYKTSMLLDFENQRPMETEAILGNAVRAAERVNVPCPHLQTLYGLMKLKEPGLQLKAKDR